MKKYILSIVVLTVLTAAGVLLVSNIMKAGTEDSGTNKMYGEFTAKGPVYAKFVQIRPEKINNFSYKDFKIETLGYSKIRVYAQLFKDDYKSVPLDKKGSLKIQFSNEMSGLGAIYKIDEYKNSVTSYIDGWADEKIYGRETKLAVSAENIPEGNYTLAISYYLLP